MRLADNWINSPWNYDPEVKEQLHFAEKIQLHDVTLRDGEQQAGLVFSHDDKIAIAEKLAEVGVHRIEAGMPAVSKEDARAVSDIVKRGLGPQIFGFARCMKSDIDKVADCGVDGVVIEIPASRRFIEKAYGWTLEKAIDLSVEATGYARERGLYTVFFPIDGSRAEFDDFMAIVSAVAKDGHMDALGCVDTMGVLSPHGVSCAIRKMKAVTGKPIEVHCHDDFGMGSANTLMALAAGADVAHTTVSSLGERSGNASYEEVAMALLTMYGIDLGLHYDKIYETAQAVRKMTGLPDRPNRPITGRGISQIESGIIAGWYKNCKEDPREIVPYLYSTTGHPPLEVVLGKSSGIASVELALEQLGMEGGKTVEREILNRVKERSGQKKALLSMEEFKQIAQQVIGQSPADQ